MKKVSPINPAITENTECMVVKIHTPVIDQNSGCDSFTVYHIAC